MTHNTADGLRPVQPGEDHRPAVTIPTSRAPCRIATGCGSSSRTKSSTPHSPPRSSRTGSRSRGTSSRSRRTIPSTAKTRSTSSRTRCRRSSGTDAFKLLSDEHVVDLNADYIKPLRQGRIEAGFKGRYRSIPVDMQFFPGQNSQIDTGAGGWATYRETDSRALRQLRVRERADRARGRRSARERAAELRRQPEPQHLQERRLSLRPAVPERAGGLEVRRIQQALALLQPARRPSERSRHPHLPQVRRAGADQGRQPCAAAAVLHVGGAGIQDQLVDAGASTPPRITGSSTAPSRASRRRRRAACCCTTSSRMRGRSRSTGSEVVWQQTVSSTRLTHRQRERVSQDRRRILRRQPVSCAGPATRRRASSSRRETSS